MNWNKHEMLVVSVVKGIKKSKKKKKNKLQAKSIYKVKKML